MWELALGVLIGAFVGVVFSVLFQRPIERIYGRLRAYIRRRYRASAPSEHDLRKLGIYQMLTWNSKRPLDPKLHVVEADHSPHPAQAWFPPTIWESVSTELAARVDGVVADVSHYTVDHREAGPASHAFALRVRRSLYSDSVAVQTLLADDGLWTPVKQLLDADLRSAMEVSPPQSFFLALCLVTSDSRCLAMRRASGGVLTSGGLWSLGCCETIGPLPDRPGWAPESLFDLAYRASREEFGIEPWELGPIWFTWLGFTRMDGPMAIAFVQTHLPPPTVIRRVLSAAGGYETDSLRWIDVNSSEMQQLANITFHDGWLSHTCIVARDLERIRSSLQMDPSLPY